MKLKVILEKVKNAEVKKILHNITWLVLERATKLILSLVVTVLVVRYLGPERFGLLSYTTAFVGLFLAFSNLGLDNITVRNLVNSPEKKADYLGTTLFLRFIGSLALLLISFCVILLLRPENSQLHLLVLIVASGYLFKSLETIDFWFQAEVTSKYTVHARIISILFISVLNVIFVFTAQPLVAFVLMYTLDSFIVGILLIFFYQKNGPISIFKWKVNLQIIKELLKDSWPLILSGVAVMVYTKIDQVMIGTMLSDRAVGFYAAAAKLSEIWLFLPIIITGSMFPSILKTRESDRKLYLGKMQNLYNGFLWFSIVVALVISLVSPIIVNLLYGDKFSQSAVVLSIHIWSGVPVFLGVATGKYLVAENLTKIILYITFIGALINVVLNLVFIPISGIIGAALATLVSYSIATMSILFFKKSRMAGMQLLKSFNFINVIKSIKK